MATNMASIARNMTASVLLAQSTIAGTAKVDRKLQADGVVAQSVFSDAGLGGSVDPDAQVWIDAGGVVGTTEISAVNNFVTTLKAEGLWSKMFYHWICSATSLPASLIDLKGNYNLIPRNSPNWSSNEIKGNATTMSFDTPFTANAAHGVSLNSYGFFVRVRTAQTGNASLMGARDNATYNVVNVQGTTRYAGNQCNYIGSGDGQYGIGTIHIIRTAPEEFKEYINGVLFRTISASTIGFPTFPMSYLCQNHSGGRLAYSNAGIVAGGEVTGLTAAEVLAHHNALVTLDAEIVNGGR